MMDLPQLILSWFLLVKRSLSSADVLFCFYYLNYPYEMLLRFWYQTQTNINSKNDSDEHSFGYIWLSKGSFRGGKDNIFGFLNDNN